MRDGANNLLVVKTFAARIDSDQAIQASQLKQLRSELLALAVVASLCVALIASPLKQVVQSFRNQ